MAASRAGGPSKTEDVMDTVHRACYSTDPLFNKPWHSGGSCPEGIFSFFVPSQGSSSRGSTKKKAARHSQWRLKRGNYEQK
jgi:hypothetical protein